MSRKLIILICLMSAMTGCADLVNQNRTKNAVSSSLTDFLYPAAQVPPKQLPSVPVLILPNRVGIAFVPGRHA